MVWVTANAELLPGSVLAKHKGGLEKEEGRDAC
jgi:hypothetical protein